MKRPVQPIPRDAAVVAFARFPGMRQDPCGIWSAPSVAGVGWFKNPDGDILSVFQQN